MKDVPGTIYIIHFERPFHHARHYVGWADDIEKRLQDHWMGRGAKILRAVRAAGIGWLVSRLMPGTRNDERKIKNGKNTSKLCPICRDEVPHLGSGYVLRMPSLTFPSKPILGHPRATII